MILASDRTTNVTGVNYVIDGGLMKTTCPSGAGPPRLTATRVAPSARSTSLIDRKRDPVAMQKRLPAQSACDSEEGIDQRP
jgi:hypothetical protein